MKLDPFYRDTIEKLGLTAPAAGRVLGVSRRQAQRLANGYPMSPPVRKLLQVMAKHRIDPKEVEGL